MNITNCLSIIGFNIFCFTGNGKKLVIDVDSHSKDEIHSFIRSTLCKTE